jgi:hypothetical protein
MNEKSLSLYVNIFDISMSVCDKLSPDEANSNSATQEIEYIFYGT